jgi:phosphoenolpyruvate synthase/pyruvate phosphate dikinase
MVLRMLEWLANNRAMEGLPVTIRLLDPPLHEFLPNEGEALSDLCRSLADVSE